jgi:hypothetical protein
LTNSTGSLEKKWNNMRDYIEEKMVHFFGLCKMKGNIVGKLGLLFGWENCERLIAGCVC